ncbi:unnamed protein product [Ilex paraguariensis]|uniref:Uncharacterized protein n=1 Tax=Ilex paraguariensis TaxID=185542 RepID=A0ABC8UB80_9AQUA
MVSLLSHSTSIHFTSHLFFNSQLCQHAHPSQFKFRPRRTNLSVNSLEKNSSFSSNTQNQPQEPPRTLFPGGFKRPEIKVPNIVLQLSSEDVLSDKSALDVIDGAVKNRVGIVVLNGGEGSGGKLYEAACLLKSVIRDRAYLMIAERVDIAAAVNASGVVLSDQGLPAIVARNAMMDSKSEAIVLPLVARDVQTLNAAVNASNFEGADFLIYGIDGERDHKELVSSVFEHVKIPIFIMSNTCGVEKLFNEGSQLLKSGASGLVISLEELKSFGDDDLSRLFYSIYVPKEPKHEKVQSSQKIWTLDTDNGFPGKKRVAGFTELEDREQQIIEKERSVLLEAINVIQRAAPLMEEVSLLIDAVSQLDEPFSLVIVMDDSTPGKGGLDFLHDWTLRIWKKIPLGDGTSGKLLSIMGTLNLVQDYFVIYVPCFLRKLLFKGEFNSGKSTVINALLGKKYLKDGVVPTTNEITFLRYSELNPKEQQYCERHPDGQYICYLPAQILKEQMIIVDTPGTNVILQRQQRLTEEFVPRADLLLFVISADRPLTESEKLLGEYMTWLQSNNAREGRLYKELFEKRWPSFIDPQKQAQLETSELLGRKYELSIKIIENFSAPAASKLFEQEIREVFLGTFGGLGAAGLSASLLTSVLPTTLEDLLALGLCSAGG